MNSFIPVLFEVNGKSLYTIQVEYSHGIINQAEYRKALIQFGKCQIHVPIKSIPRLLIDEVLNPFYIF